MRKTLSLILFGLWAPLAWAGTDTATRAPVPAAPSAGQQALLNACLRDMPRRVGPFGNHPDLVCACMFTGPTAWQADPDPAQAEAQAQLVAAAIARGGMNLDLRATGRREGMDKPVLDKLEIFARVYPAVLFQNKAVVQCFNDKCAATSGCKVEMNNVSGTAPVK